MRLLCAVESLTRRAEVHFQKRQNYCGLSVHFGPFEAQIDARLS
jgi:hypothetical protein